MKINKELFGITQKGENVTKYTVDFSKIKVEFLDYGCTIKALYTPDKDGNMENIVLGYDKLALYENEPPCYFGCIVGRIAGRTQNGILDIKGKKYQLTQNNGRNNLHGGTKGLHNRVWSSSAEEISGKAVITFKTFSPHMEEGFPGELNITVRYIVDENSISIEYEGIPDRETYISLTNHVFFNLSGNMKRTIHNQILNFNANGYYAVDKEILPIKLVEKDEIFAKNRNFSLGEALELGHEQIKIVGNGYDHPFELSKDGEIDGYAKDIQSGRRIDFITNQPVVVLYTGNFIDLATPYEKYSGFCLETQDYPDIWNLIPEKMKIYSETNPYEQKTKFIFSISK